MSELTSEKQQEIDGSDARIVCGGTVESPFIDIKFQLGPVGLDGITNGCQIEDVLEVLIARLQGFQAGPFSCRENALAITKLEEAAMWLEMRTRRRRSKGVEGTYHPH